MTTTTASRMGKDHVVCLLVCHHVCLQKGIRHIKTRSRTHLSFRYCYWRQCHHFYFTYCLTEHTQQQQQPNRIPFNSSTKPRSTKVPCIEKRWTQKTGKFSTTTLSVCLFIWAHWRLIPVLCFCMLIFLFLWLADQCLCVRVMSSPRKFPSLASCFYFWKIHECDDDNDVVFCLFCNLIRDVSYVIYKSKVYICFYTWAEESSKHVDMLRT